MASKATLKYLKTYSEPESQNINVDNGSYDFVIVIPVCYEELNCLESVFKNTKQNNVLIIVVVNSPIGNHEFQLSNQLFIDNLIQNSINQSTINSNCSLLKFSNSNDIFLVDRNSDDLQIKADFGVGQARKIGADVALNLFTQGYIKSPWIFSTDADVILPENYFCQFIQDLSNYSAVVLDFEHVTDDRNMQKLQYMYDFKLRYYLAGIQYASCGYEYIPLGSTLIVNMECYAQVRGFPKRNAGEDFYILNKLAKVKPLKYCTNDSIVQINSRFSNRVPFGTGPALVQISQLNDFSDYRYYHPQCFICLKKWHGFLISLWDDNQLAIKAPTDKYLLGLFEFFNCQNIFEKSKKQITSGKRWQQFVSQWFDAFKVLKSVHFFDKKFNRLNYLQLLNDEAFAKVNSSRLQNFINHYDKT